MSIRPDYYKNGSIEVFDIIKAFGKDLTGIEAFYFGNILKYVCRFKQKNGIEDLRKAETYLKLLIEHEESIPEKDRIDLSKMLYYNQDKGIAIEYNTKKGTVTMSKSNESKNPVTETFRFDGYDPESNHFYRDIDKIRLVYEPAFPGSNIVSLIGWYRPDSDGDD